MISIFFAVSSLIAQPPVEEELITDNTSVIEEVQEIVLEDEESEAFKDEDEG